MAECPGDRSFAFLSIKKSMNNLLGYPHGEEAAWREYISVEPDEVRTVLERVRLALR